MASGLTGRDLYGFKCDPVMELLKRRRWGKLRFALSILALVAGCFLYFYFAWDSKTRWLYTTALALACVTISALSWVSMQGRVASIPTIPDYFIHVGVRLIKLFLLAALGRMLWAMGMNREFYGPLTGELVNIMDMRNYMESPPINPYQVAALLAFIPAMRVAYMEIQKTKRFLKELNPAQTTKVIGLLDQAAMLGRTPGDASGSEYVDEASMILREANETDNRAINHHRALVREKIAALRQEHGWVSGNIQRAAQESLPTQREEPDRRQAAARRAPDNSPHAPYREFFDGLRHQSKVAWTDVVGLDETLDEMKAAFAIAFSKKSRHAEIESPRNFLLYGPPGTGKTLAAGAISANMNIPFYSVKVSDVLSKYFGETPKLISALYHFAAQDSPSILFFDEIEAISAKADEAKAESEELRALSTLRAELDGLKSKGGGSHVFTFASTNAPWLLDPAILSRFDILFHVPLPRSEARRKMFELFLNRRGFTVEFPIEKLVQATRGYSGRELGNLCKNAVSKMISGSNPSVREFGGEGDAGQIAERSLLLRPISVENFNSAFRRVRPQTDPALAQRYLDWTGAVA